jgi:hypothetical protein
LIPRWKRNLYIPKTNVLDDVWKYPLARNQKGESRSIAKGKQKTTTLSSACARTFTVPYDW